MRAFRLLSLLAAGSLSFTSCGGDDDNPAAVDVKNLKYPQGLAIVDNGDGSVQLSWTASNFERDFEGYNIYAAQMSDADIKALADHGLEKGKPIQLLDDEGKPRNQAKEILSAMNFDPNSGIANLTADENADKANDEDTDTKEDEENPKFSFYPIHSKNSEGKPILPTCYPSEDNAGEYTCTNYTATNVEAVKDEKDAELIAHGTVTYDIKGLKFDKQYCFLIFTVQDSGEEISQTSTNFECIRPKYKFSGSFPIANDKSMLIADFAQKCKADGACPTNWDTTNYREDLNAADTGKGSEQLAGEGLGTGDLSFTPGLQSSCGIKNYGYRPSGFSDPDLPSEAPTFDNAVAKDGKIANSNGYSPRGQSIVIAPQYMYVLACADNDDKVFYYWIHVNQTNAITSADTAITVDMRLSATAR